MDKIVVEFDRNELKEHCKLIGCPLYVSNKCEQKDDRLVGCAIRTWVNHKIKER